MTDSEVQSDAALREAPAPVTDLAAAAVDYVQRAVGMAVDFTPETLPIVDHYVALAREQIADRPALLPLVTRALGAYFGQVAVRSLDGFWHVPSDDAHTWWVCLRPVLLAFNPVGVAYEVLHQGGPHEGPSPEIRLARDERAVVEARLQALPAVEEREYFMLATRLEVVEIARAALMDLRDEGTADVEFDWDDYRDVVGAG